MKHLFSLIPYYKICKNEKVSPWYFVFLNKWINTHKLFNPKWETSLMYDSKNSTLIFTCYWLKSNNKSNEFFFNKWRMPWKSSIYQIEQFKDTFKTNFYVYNKSKRITIKATVHKVRLYYSLFWLPPFLKKLFKKTKEIVHIHLNNPKQLFITYKFKQDLPTSWLNFEYYELSKYLKNLQLPLQK